MLKSRYYTVTSAPPTPNIDRIHTISSDGTVISVEVSFKNMGSNAPFTVTMKLNNVPYISNELGTVTNNRTIAVFKDVPAGSYVLNNLKFSVDWKKYTIRNGVTTSAFTLMHSTPISVTGMSGLLYHFPTSGGGGAPGAQGPPGDQGPPGPPGLTIDPFTGFILDPSNTGDGTDPTTYPFDDKMNLYNINNTGIYYDSERRRYVTISKGK